MDTDHPPEPAAKPQQRLVKVGSLRSLPPGEMMEVEVDGESFVISNVSGSLHALSGICPHRDAPLAQGALHGHTIVCPWHAWEWDCRTGRSLNYPDQSIRVFEVETSGDDIFLRIGPRA